MIRQATVEDISNRGINKLHGHIVVVTRYYPRFLKKNLMHEYRSELAPTKELLKEFKLAEKECGDHDEGFIKVDYENKFELDESGLYSLKELSDLSAVKNVYLVCHCKNGQYCHRELLLLMAEELFGAKISKVSFPYTNFRKRLKEGALSKF